MGEKLYARDIYGKTLVELGKKDNNIVVLDADLSGSTRTNFFAREFPERFFNFGVAEQNMMAASAGLASCGKIVFVSTFAMFATGRCWDQIRNTVCYNNFNVKIVATHGGITVGPDGASHQAIEDIALMRSIPNMRIIVPCDAYETKDAVVAAYNTPGPFYVRLGRAKVATIPSRGKFRLGKGYILREGKDVTLIACGIMVYQALDAAELLAQEGIQCRVVNLHTIKPIDAELIEDCACKTQGIITCEEHMVTGGLGSAVSEVIVNRNLKIQCLRIGIQDKFGQSGEPDDLIRQYKMTPEDIKDKVKVVLA